MERDVRAMARVALGAATALALLAGCLGEPADQGMGGPAPEAAPAPVTYAGDCSAALLFQFIDYAQTDRYLPPGFHPRDPQELLSFIPVAVGQAGVILLAVECRAGQDEPVSYSSVGIFVEPPFVEGYEPGLFDFYEVDRYGTRDPYRAALRLASWPEHDADVVLSVDGTTSGEGADTVEAAVTDAEGPVASFNGLAGGEVGVGEGAIRFWHDSPRGLGLLEITTSLTAHIGGGGCTARSGTAFADFVGGTQCVPPAAENIVAAFPAFTIDSSARFLPGVHAE